MFWMRLNKSVISILNKFDILVIFVIRILIREAKMIRSGSTSQVLRLGTTCNCLKGVVVLNQILHELAALPEGDGTPGRLSPLLSLMTILLVLSDLE